MFIMCGFVFRELIMMSLLLSIPLADISNCRSFTNLNTPAVHLSSGECRSCNPCVTKGDAGAYHRELLLVTKKDPGASLVVRASPLWRPLLLATIHLQLYAAYTLACTLVTL